MERKIGEIFELNGEWYQCIVGNDCEDCNFCAFNERKCYTVVDNGDPIGNCCADRRKDNKDVIFKKLEKVGEPYMLEDIKFQKYKVFKTPYIYHKIDYSWQSFSDPYYISLEIKKDMEEKKLNLKPFDIQKAREGKPVCTRDGRKARIICFDRDCDMHIVALVADPLGESVHYYLSNGKVDFDKNNDHDLMMAPERHEGWINVYKGGKLDADFIYPTKADAVENIFPPMKDKYIDTIKLTWEELP